MATTTMEKDNIDCLANLRTNRYDWTIKVRIIRRWRNSNMAGKLVNGINLLLLDDKDVTMQAFVGGKCYEQYNDLLDLGKVFLISNFSVKDVATDASFLLTSNERHISFTVYTTVEEVQENESLIADNSFDFYDIEDLSEVLNQTKFLIDVMGVIQDYQPIRRWASKQDKTVKKAIVKFILTDGSASIRVVLWDDFAERFQPLLNAAEEAPFIAIIAGARVVKSEDEIQIAAARATHYFINNNNNIVGQMRQMMSTNPVFTQPNNCTATADYPVYTVKNLTTTGIQNIGGKVVLMLTVRNFVNGSEWFFFECTTCKEELKKEAGAFFCGLCQRNVTYPDRKFMLGTISDDYTGTITLVLNDPDVKRLTMNTALMLTTPSSTVTDPIPEALYSLINKDIRALVDLNDDHVAEGCNVFTASHVILGHIENPFDQGGSSRTTLSNLNSNYQEGSTSTMDYHLETMTAAPVVETVPTPVSIKTRINKSKNKKKLAM